METLFITDLDGTLLNKEARLSENSCEILCSLMEQGLNITVASGRTPLSVFQILKNLPLKLPLILMNGVLLVEPQTRHILSHVPFSEKGSEILKKEEEALGLGGLFFAVKEKNIAFSLNCEFNSHWEDFFIRNSAAHSIPFLHKGYFEENIPVIYGIYMENQPEKLFSLKEKLAETHEFTLDFYKDMYHHNTWCLEVYSASASKYKAVTKLRQETKAKHIVAFGDNLNDLALFQASDECYAVANGKPEVKSAAQEVIGHHDQDGVAKFLQKIWKEKHGL